MLVVRATDLARFTYCARLPFFDRFMPIRPPLPRRLKMLWGKCYHFFKRLTVKGVKEELLEAEVNGVRLVGKPDVYQVHDGRAVVYEFKSYRSPGRTFYVKGLEIPCYPRDFVQLLAYGFLVGRSYDVDDVIMILQYRDQAFPFKLDNVLESVFCWVVEEYRFTIENAIIHDVIIDHKCQACQYLDLCLKIEKEMW